MAEVEASRIFIDVTTNGASANAILGKLDGNLKNLNGVLDKQNDRVKKTQSEFLSLSNILKTVAVGYLVKEFSKLTDTYANVNNKIKLVTSGSEDLARTQKKLFDLAQSSRSSYESTAELYARLSRSTRELNVSQDDLLTVTDSINKAFIVSGASAEESSNAIRQLSQGLAAGALRGDEFNSVAEQAPRLQEAIAASLGVTIGELRGLAAEGKITSEVIVKALKGQAGVINNEFAQITPTIGQLTQTLKNTLVNVVGRAGQEILPDLAILGRSFIALSKDGGVLVDSLGFIIKQLITVAKTVVGVVAIVQKFGKSIELEDSSRIATENTRGLVKNVKLAREEFNLSGKTLKEVEAELRKFATSARISSKSMRAAQLLAEIEKQKKGLKSANESVDSLIQENRELDSVLKDIFVETGKKAENAKSSFDNLEKSVVRNKKTTKELSKVYKEALSILAETGDFESNLKLQNNVFQQQINTVKKAGLDTTALIQFQEKQRTNLIKASLAESTNLEEASFDEKMGALKTQYSELLNNDKLSYKDRETAHKAFVEQTRLLEQQRFQAFNENFQLFAQGATDLMSIFQNLSTLRLNASNAEIAKLEEDAAKRQELANQNIANLQMQGATTEEIAALEAQRDAENIASQEQIAQKKRELARKQAQEQKKFGRFSIIIDTATAIAKALATVPPPASYALAALSAAKGATQLALNESTPIPAAQFGGSFQIPAGNQADSGIVRVNQGENVTVEPVRQSGNDSPKTVTLVIDGQQFRGYFIDNMNKFLNSGDVQIRRSGAIRTA